MPVVVACHYSGSSVAAGSIINFFFFASVSCPSHGFAHAWLGVVA